MNDSWFWDAIAMFFGIDNKARKRMRCWRFGHQHELVLFTAEISHHKDFSQKTFLFSIKPFPTIQSNVNLNYCNFARKQFVYELSRVETFLTKWTH